MQTRSKLLTLAMFSFLAILYIDCSKSSDNGGTVTPTPTPVPTPVPTPTPVASEIEYWLTTSNKSSLLQKQNTVLNFGTIANTNPDIVVDSTFTFQTVDGFGYTLTGGSAQVINQLNPTTKAELLQELFGNAASSIGVSYLRISIGASDLTETVFSYDDVPAGQTDANLDKFSLGVDETSLVPLLKEILAINPSIKILGSPWSAPVWMKDNGSFKGGSLQPSNHGVYAKYFVKYIQTMKAKGINIDAITIQNEPLNPNNNPSMSMSAAQQTEFIKNHLGPLFKTAGINTKIIIFDHNCDQPGYPAFILNDAVARAYVDGSAFHLYAGDITTLGYVRNAHQDKNIYFTEQWTSSTGDFGGDFMWHIKNVIIGSMNNWSKTALEWNLANDPSFGPRTPGGCTECKGALTIKSVAERNVAYYIIAQISKFVPPNSVRIASNSYNKLTNVAFKTPLGKKVLLVLNENTSSTTFNIKYRDKWAVVTLPASSAGTFVW